MRGVKKKFGPVETKNRIQFSVSGSGRGRHESVGGKPTRAKSSQE